jgi:hypothetical protein
MPPIIGFLSVHEKEHAWIMPITMRYPNTLFPGFLRRPETTIREKI